MFMGPMFMHYKTAYQLEYQLLFVLALTQVVDSRYIFNVASYLQNQLQTPTRVSELFANNVMID